MTRLLGLIGFPLGHSWSKAYFAEKFRREGIRSFAYELFPIQDAGMIGDLIRDNPQLEGLNVTIPHKEAIIPFLDKLSGSAAAIGAVNTIAIDRKQGGVFTTGYNTDAFGFDRSLDIHQVTGTGKALVLGTGGASRAVVHVLLQRAWSVTLVSRRPATSEAHKSHGGAMSEGHNKNGTITTLGYEQVSPPVLLNHQLIVNTTPLGMYPETKNYPALPYQALTKNHILYDLVYNPEVTEFLSKGAVAGCQVIGGLDMLKLQAERSFEIWKNRVP